MTAQDLDPIPSDPAVRPLDGLRVALLEARMSEEIAALIRKQGGEPRSVPAVRERARPCPDEIRAMLDTLAGAPDPVFVLSTGVGLKALLSDADALGRKPELLALLRRATTVCRGPKPGAALRQEGLEASIKVGEPHTTRELLAALEAVELRGRPVVLVHYGERNVPLVEALTGRAARLLELLVYEWSLPEDLGPLAALVDDLIAGAVQAVAFTSQVQVRHLFHVANLAERAEALRAALKDRAVVAAVGPTCAQALVEAGVEPQVVPVHPKMGPMVRDLGRYFADQRASAARS